jgi:hypothetical protein
MVNDMAKVPAWRFDPAEADAAYDAAVEAAHAAATAEKTLNTQSRALAKAVYGLVISVLPLDELANLKRKLNDERESEDRQIVLPANIVSFLQAKQLPLPHLGAINLRIPTKPPG